MAYGSHYSRVTNDTERLKGFAEWAAGIIARQHIGANPILLYRGMSGCVTATAVRLELHKLGIEVATVYIRKETDHHGDTLEWQTQQKDGYDSAYQWFKEVTRTWYFIDDFIETGETFETCLAQATRYFKMPTIKNLFTLTDHGEAYDHRSYVYEYQKECGASRAELEL